MAQFWFTLLTSQPWAAATHSAGVAEATSARRASRVVAEFRQVALKVGRIWRRAEVTAARVCAARTDDLAKRAHAVRTTARIGAEGPWCHKMTRESGGRCQ